MSNEYEETQKEINKLLWETSQIKKNKRYQNIKKDEKYK